MPEYLGEFLDGLGNKITMLAVANPSPPRRTSPERNHDRLTTRAAGFGLVKFNIKTRKITVECWPRNVDLTAPGAEEYPGWPRTIDQLDNYGRRARAYLPTVKLSGMTNPVVQVIDEQNDEVIYTVRIKGSSFRPKVFKTGATYTVKVGEPATGQMKTLKAVQPVSLGRKKALKVSF